MKKLILTEGTEFEQNGKDLAIIDTDQRGGKPIMLDSSDLDASIINGETQALDRISVDVSNEPQVEVIATTEDQTITPGEEYTGLSSVVVKGVTSDIDSDIQPENILKGVNILGTTGTATTGAYILVDGGVSTGYNSDVNKATIRKILEDMESGDYPIVYLFSRYSGGGGFNGSGPNKYYMCNIDKSNANGITFRAYIGICSTGGVQTKNNIAYYPEEWLWVYCPITDGEPGTITNGVNTEYAIHYNQWTDNSPVAYNNTTAFTPTSDYNLANKKYVDDSIGAIQVPDVTPYETYSSNIGRFPVFNWQPNIVMSGNGSSLGSSDLNLLRGYIQDMYNKGKSDFAIYCALKDDNGSGNYYVPHRFLLLQRHTKAIYAKPTSMQFVGFSIYDQSFNATMAHTLLSLTLSWSGDTVTVSSGYITAYRREYVVKSDLSNYLSKNNSTEFTPTGDYQPATKKYVDILAGGSPKNIFEIEYDFSMMGTPQWYSTTDTLGVAYIAKINEVYKKGIDNFIIRIIKPDRSFYLDIIININRTNHTVSDTGINTGHWDSSGAGYVDKYFAIGTNYGNGFEYDSTNDAFTHESGSILAFWISEPDLARKADVITKSNTTSYTPTADYNPATKKYVDDAVAGAGGGVGYNYIYVDCSGLTLNNTYGGDAQYIAYDIPTAVKNKLVSEYNALIDASVDIHNIVIVCQNLPKWESRSFTFFGGTLELYSNLATDSTSGNRAYDFVSRPITSAMTNIWKNTLKPTYMQYQIAFYANDSHEGYKVDDVNGWLHGWLFDNTRIFMTEDTGDTRYLSKSNTSSFTPSGDYNPATKKYVDDAVAGAGGSSSLEEEVFLIKTTRGISELSEGNPISITDSTVLNELSTKVTAALNTDKLLKGHIQFSYTPPNGGRDFVDLYADYPVTTGVGYYRFYSSPVLSKTTVEGQSIYMIQAVALGNWVNNVYTATKIELTIIKSTFIAKDNTIAYTPTNDYNPATKKYVDDSVSAITSPALTLSNTSFDLGYDIEGETIDDDDITAINTFAQTIGLASGGNKQITLNVTDTNSINRQFQAIIHRTTTTASGVTTDVITIHCFDAAGMIFTLYTSKTSESGQEDVLFGEYDSLGLVDFPSLTRFLTEIGGYDDSKTQVLKNISGTLTWVDE